MNHRDPVIEKRVADIMSRMTLEDKVGEMTQLAIDTLSVGEPQKLVKPHQFDPEKLRHVLVDLRVGSILNVGGYAYSREYWHEIIQTIKSYSDQKESKIPVLYGIDAIHGTNYTREATLYPQQLGLAATWDTELVEQLGRITAYETRASGIPWTFSPVCDLGRDPRWPRLWEGFGEDPLLAGDLAAAMTRGYQGENPGGKYQVAACMKHFLGYSPTIVGTDRTEAWIPERQLREYFLPAFQRAIEAGVLTVMINSGEMNGIPVHCNKYILTDLLRDELGFEGLAVTDWEDIIYLYTRHRVAKDHKDAIALAINAGIDMSMVAFNTEFPTLLAELVREGRVPMERIDESVRRILQLKVRLGLFEQVKYDPADYPDFNSDASEALSLRAAQDSLVLLKNENDILPVDKSERLLVTGPTANSMIPLNGGWTWVWQGDEEEYVPDKYQPIFQALQHTSAATVDYVPGTTYDEELDIAAAVAAAKQADVIITCLGEFSYTEYEGNLNDLNLPEAQINLVRALAQTGKPLVLVLAQGRPRIIRQITDLADGILYAPLPGNQGGTAIASVLFGDCNPSGKLPITYPGAANALLNYDHKGTDLVGLSMEEKGLNPQFPFGHGLSYTHFTYDKLQLSNQELRPDGTLTISVELTNTGDRAGREVVQLYVTDLVASITPAVKRLRGYQKIQLEAGGTKTVTFTIRPRDLAFVGQDHRWTTEPGEFTVMIDNLEAGFDFVADQPVVWGG